MRGFDDKWRDVPDFIIGITKEIWEDLKIGLLRNLYADGLVVRSPASVVQDNSNVIAATMATLAEFPDRELLGEDVIWCEDADGATDTSDAFMSSNRLICTATHSHDGLYGAATGKRLTYRILADCAIRDGAVYDEWMVRDQSAIVAQMGHDLVDWTRDLIACAAVRWSLHGKHAGWGRFGKPTGAEIYVMGISHAEFGPFAGNGTRGDPTIRREYTLIDETAIWKQILLKTGQHP